MAAPVESGPGIVDVHSFERSGKPVRVALAAHLPVGDDVEPGPLLIPKREQRRVVLRLLQIGRIDAPQLPRPHPRRKPLAQPVAVYQPVRLSVGPHEGGRQQPHHVTGA